MYEFGADFIARCLAGEAINEAKKKQWKLVAGDNIILLDNLEDETTTISTNDQLITVDDKLSLTSENPVQNKVITDVLRTKPTTVINNGLEVKDQKIMQLTRAQYDAIKNKDPNTYYMITDDTDAIDEVPDVTSSDDGKVLTATYSGGVGSYAWATAGGGELNVETDGTNYWITVNGIKLYFASSEPTGTNS